MNILITGATGFVGSSLVQFLSNENNQIYTTSRSKSHNDNQTQICLGEPFPANYFKNHQIDLVIHCAHSFKKGSMDININGTINWAISAKKEGVQKQIFISSISAITDNESEYAKSKKEVEQWFLENQQIILRPGLIIGNGGLFYRMVKIVKLSPIIPLLGGSSKKLFFTNIYILLRVVSAVVHDTPKYVGAFNVQNKEGLTLKEMIQTIALCLNAKRICVNIPLKPILLFIQFLELVGLKNLPINSSNIKGLNSNDLQEIKSDLEKFSITDITLIEQINRVLKKAISNSH